MIQYELNPLNAELNPICHLLALLVAHHILHVSGLRVNDVGLRCGLYNIMNQRVNCYKNSYMAFSLQIEADLGRIV